MPRRISSGLFVLLLMFSFSPALFAQTLQTRFSTIHYEEESEIQDFLWRITGKRLAGGVAAAELTRSRVDEIIERVEAVLDMRPDAFHIDIRLQKEYRGGAVAYYSHESRTITASADRVTDGVLAHEIAHAIMNVYFSVPPPEKTQEILAQYVDQNLWSEVI